MASFMSKSLAVLLLSISPVLCVPVVLPPGASAVLVPRQSTGTCMNQSCEVAAVAGSTGATDYSFPSYPQGSTPDGNCCIVRHFPAVKDALYAAMPSQKAYCASHGGDAPVDANPPGVNSVTVNGQTPPHSKRAPAAACKPKILIFARGTFEPGDLGITVGNSLKSNLNANEWDVRGVSYDNSIDGDYCLGLPGGVMARTALHQAVTDCPNSLIAMSGYSQGAMVVRNAIARAPASDVARVKNVVTFGDPFDGAPIGQYNGPRTVYCLMGDGVCTGNFDITFAHLSYGQDVSAAVRVLESTHA